MNYCHACGGSVGEDFRFCPSCGQSLSTPLAAATPRPAVRVDRGRHVRILGVLLSVWGFLGLLGAGAMFLAVGPLAHVLDQVLGHRLPASLVPSLLFGLGWVFGAIAVGTIAAGIGLLNYEGWARPLALVVLLLALVRFPFGTALGIYGLWVLLSGDGERSYRELAASRG